MPAKSKNQLKMIYAKRSQYGNKDKTPEKWKWIWEKDWTDVKMKNLPQKAEHKKNNNYINEFRKVVKEEIKKCLLAEAKKVTIDRVKFVVSFEINQRKPYFSFIPLSSEDYDKVKNNTDFIKEIEKYCNKKLKGNYCSYDPNVLGAGINIVVYNFKEFMENLI